MDVLIKLKDCDLIKIHSTNDYFQERRDYYDTDTVKLWYGKFKFTFREPQQEDVQWVRCVRTDCGEFIPEEMDFTYIASFFYGKDFSNVTCGEFIQMFSSYVCGEIIKEEF